MESQQPPSTVTILKGYPTVVLLVTAAALNMSLYMLRTHTRRRTPIPIQNRALKLAISATLFALNLTICLHILNAIIMFFVIPGSYSFVVPRGELSAPTDGRPVLPPGWSPVIVENIVPLKRGVALQAAVWRAEGADGNAAALPPAAERRWLMWANMNAQGMTNAAPYVGHYAQSLGVERAVVFNYRGVGGSRGSPTCASDLVDDTVAMIRYLETAHGVNSSLLLIHGQSLGATVAVPAAARAKSRGPVVSDRGFSSLHDIALSRLKQPLFSAFFGSALSMLSFGSMMQAAHAGQYTRDLGLAKPWLVTQVLTVGGGALAAALGITPIVDPVMTSLGWTLDAATPWMESVGERVVIYHKDDGIITYDSSLQLAVVEAQARKEGRSSAPVARRRGGRYSRKNHPVGSAEFELHGGCKSGPECHLYPLYKDRKEWTAWITIARRLLGMSGDAPAVKIARAGARKPKSKSKKPKPKSKKPKKPKANANQATRSKKEL